jgi:hypothetical protein
VRSDVRWYAQAPEAMIAASTTRIADIGVTSSGIA